MLYSSLPCRINPLLLTAAMAIITNTVVLETSPYVSWHLCNLSSNSLLTKIYHQRPARCQPSCNASRRTSFHLNKACRFLFPSCLLQTPRPLWSKVPQIVKAQRAVCCSFVDRSFICQRDRRHSCYCSNQNSIKALWAWIILIGLTVPHSHMRGGESEYNTLNNFLEKENITTCLQIAIQLFLLQNMTTKTSCLFKTTSLTVNFYITSFNFFLLTLSSATIARKQFYHKLLKSGCYLTELGQTPTILSNFHMYLLDTVVPIPSLEAGDNMLESITGY